MLLEFLFFDKSKRSQVETFNDELKARWSKAKEDDLPPTITYKDFDKTEYWIVKYEKSGGNEQVARQLSEIGKQICEEFFPTILTDESSEYFNKSLYPLVNKFERYLRKLLYLKVALCNEEKLKSAIRDIEKKDFGDIYSILFVDNDFRSKARDQIKKLNTRAEMVEAIDGLREQTAWDILIGNSVLAVIKDNFDLLKEYRNDVMHAHNISYDRYKDIKKLFSKANAELEEQINEILQYSPVTMVSSMTVDTLYNKLVAFTSGVEKIANGAARFADWFARLSTETVPPETLSNLERFLLLLGATAESEPIEGLLAGFSSPANKEMLSSNENEVSTRE